MQYSPIEDSNLLLQQAMFESSYAAVTALAFNCRNSSRLAQAG